MNIPVTVGLPQILLFLVAIVGIGLLVSAVLGSRTAREESDWKSKYRGSGSQQLQRHPRRRIHFGRGLGGVLLLGLALTLLWLTFLVQSYLGLTSNVRVARVHASKIENTQHVMSVELTLYDKAGNTASTNTYLVKGDEWEVQGNIIKFPDWMGMFGLRSGYKLTRLEGRFDDPDMERNSTHSVIVLNGGDDQFFKTIKPQTWLSPLVEAAYGNAVIQGTGQKGNASFDVLVSQTGLYAEPVSG